jgi:hypothetical protein
VTINRIDSTLKNGKTGYHVQCKNKNVDQNELSVRPIGFESGARDANFIIRGRVIRAQMDDFNNDGYPDLAVFICSDSSALYGTVFAFISEANKSISICALPDVQLNGKISMGYKGHDEFSLMEGYLLQKFPIYKPGDNKDSPSGGVRSILYQIGKNEEGGFKFNLVRSYDTQ